MNIFFLLISINKNTIFIQIKNVPKVFTTFGTYPPGCLINFIGTLGYTNQTGISINSGMERFTGRIDANSKWNKFEYGMNATFSWTRNKHTPEGQYYASALYSSKYQLIFPPFCLGCLVVEVINKLSKVNDFFIKFVLPRNENNRFHRQIERTKF